MKSTAGLLLLAFLIVFLWGGPHSSPVAAPGPSAAPVSGPWTTGAVGTLGDVVYAPGEHYINLSNEGLYDPVLWVVILDYNTLTIEAGATVRFLNHPTRAPVVIRAVGDIVIAGELNLDGADGRLVGDALGHSEPGPGGFRGGTGIVAALSEISDGHGPGGGFNDGSHPSLGTASGSHATIGSANSFGAVAGAQYGSGFAVPLIGGSGGTGAGPGFGLHNSGGGGAGGGAILLGSDTSIHLSGLISVGGGDGSDAQPWGFIHAGSGGLIRLASPVITWGGTGIPVMDATGGWNGGGDGWIRVETPGVVQLPSTPGATYAQQLGTFLPTSLPTVTLSSWWDDTTSQWVPMGQDPHSVIDDGMRADVQLPTSGVRTLRVEGIGIPLNAPLHVRITDTQGRAVVDSTHTVGEVAGSTLALSWTDVQVDFSLGVSTVQVRAELP